MRSLGAGASLYGGSRQQGLLQLQCRPRCMQLVVATCAIVYVALGWCDVAAWLVSALHMAAAALRSLVPCVVCSERKCQA